MRQTHRAVLSVCLLTLIGSLPPALSAQGTTPFDHPTLDASLNYSRFDNGHSNRFDDIRARGLGWEALAHSNAGQRSEAAAQARVRRPGLDDVPGDLDQDGKPGRTGADDNLEVPGNDPAPIVTTTPEPATFALLFAGVAGIAFLAKRRPRGARA